MKIFFRCLFVCLCLVAIERFTRSQTDGFRETKTTGSYSFCSHWPAEKSPLDPTLLDQPFYFLGSGVQCYAFIGEDNSTVLKVFKHYHFGLSTQSLEKLPLPKCLHTLRRELLVKRKKRMEHIFSSAIIARHELSEQTGVFYLCINPNERAPPITIYDKIGVRRTLDLSATPFLLQRKANLLLPYIKKHKEEAKQMIDSLFCCIVNRSKKGISNSDPRLYRNFGILDGKVIEIDVGSFSENPFVKSPIYTKRELFYETLEMKEWILQNQPELSDYFEERISLALQA